MLAMAAAMVGCSQEELVVDGLQNATVNLSGRPVLGEVVLGTGVNSRMAIAEGSAIQAEYVEGDKIGAALFDTPAYLDGTAPAPVAYGTGNFSSLSWSWADYAGDVKKNLNNVEYSFAQAGADAKVFYNTQNWISSNYPFTCDEDGKFYTNAELVEGNYMFYLPYAENYRIREALKVVLPQIQDCSDEVMRETTKGTAKVQTSSTALSQFFAGEMEGFEGVMAVAGYQFLGKDNTRPEVSLEPLYAYPLITIKNNFNSFVYGSSRTIEAAAPATKTMVIDSIQVYYAGTNTNPLFYKASLKKEITEAMGGATSWWNKRFTSEGATTDQIMTASDAVYAKHSASAYGLPKINADLATPSNRFAYVGNNHITLVLNKELANGESYSFHAVLPAADYGHDLKARVYATIDGKACVISDIKNEPYAFDEDDNVIKYQSKNYANYSKDYAFVDAAHGDEDLVLIRGEHYPKAEFALKNAQITGLKAFCGDMMTINLASTIAEDGSVIGATAFELVEVGSAPVQSDKGIVDNADFIAYMTSYIQNGVPMTEDDDLSEEERTEWTAGNLAFAENNTVIINAELVEEIYAQVNEDNQGVVALTLNATQLAVGADVKAETFTEGLVSGYIFSTMNTGADAKNYSIKVAYGSGMTYNTVGTALVKGINKITAFATANKTLAVKSGESNAVVELSTNATYAGATGINAIYLTAGTLTVNSACDVMIVATGGNIVIGANGSLTNANNKISVPVTNNNGKQIAGTLTAGTVVSATYTQWPTEALAQNSRINNVTIAPATNQILLIENEQINMLGNLTGVTVNLGANVKAIKSANDVTLSKINAIKAAAAIEWNNINAAYGYITVSSTTAVEFNNISEGQGTVFGSNVNHFLTPVNKAGIEAAFAAGKTVKLISNITLTQSLKVTAGQNATINLNGYNITSSYDVFEVQAGGKLTINGNENSQVFAMGDAVAAPDGVCAVFANGGEVTINGGHFKTNDDQSLHRDDCIYAKGGGKITINNGKFEYVGSNADGHKFLLNCKDDSNSQIIVNGGTFKNHVPSKEAVGNGEVVLGTDKKVYNGETEVTTAHTSATDVWYTVK